MEAANNLATDSLFVNNGKVLTSSLDVADSFGKKHKNVLRDIQHLVDSGEVGGLKFEPTNYLDSQGRSKPCFSMTRDGFILVVMGYKTKAALGIKQRYIDAYNAMEARLREVDGTVPVQVDAVTAALEAAGLRKAVTELRLVTSSSGLSTA
jgi:Rha family phage regulatory protein